MNKLELEMVDLLINLKVRHGAVEVKAEFEAEASRINELMRLKEIACKADLGLVIKIGGAEAITDMFEAEHIGVTGLIAPMIESGYAMKKFIEAVKKYFAEDLRKNIHFGVNIETIQGFKNLKDILGENSERLVDGITLGRVDMIGSFGLGRNDINSKKMFEIAKQILTVAKKNRLRTTMGGGITVEAIPFIQRLVAKKLLDCFETRKIVFNLVSGLTSIDEGLIKANKFELLWLENKRNYYSSIFHEDDSRIEMVKKRIIK